MIFLNALPLREKPSDLSKAVRVITSFQNHCTALTKVNGSIVVGVDRILYRSDYFNLILENRPLMLAIK